MVEGPEPRKTSIQSVARSSRILLAIARSKTGLAAQAVADQFGLTLSTAYHLLSTLAAESLLAKVEGKRYILGPGAGEIANAVARELRPPQAYLLALERLAATTGESTFLTGWHFGRIRIVANVEGSQALRVAGLDVGYTDSVHARASSKLLLAYAEESIRDSILDACDFTAFSPNTITDRASFEKELRLVRREGIARDRGEFNRDVYSVSAPIWETGAVRSALAVSAPVTRFAENERSIITALRKESGALSSGHAD